MDPIDKLFLEKLKNHEVQPSDKANKLFLSKMQMKEDKKKLPFWWTMSLAASLFIVGFGGFYFSKNQNLVEIFQNKQFVEAAARHFDKVGQENPLIIEKKQGNVLESLNHTKEKVFSKSIDKNYPSQTSKKQELVIAEKSSQLFENQLLNQIVETVQIAKIEEKSQTISNIDAQQETIIFLTPMLAMNRINDSQQKALTVKDLQSNSESGEDYFSEEKSLFARVIDEVKNLKKGEKVDFNKLGFKPIDELALNQGGFIVSESHQIKEKLNWIKSRLNNN
jgi:hypothetical protein